MELKILACLQAQGYHWSGIQTTIHPWVAYYKQDGEIRSVSAAVISDRLKHDTQSVHAYKRAMIGHLRDLGIPVNHIYYFSGCIVLYLFVK